MQNIFFFIRHGETNWNKLYLCQGHIDQPLDEKGKEQAEATGLILKKMNINFDYGVHTHLSRSKDTLNIIIKALQSKNIIEFEDDDFLERNFGDLEGKDVSYVRQMIFSPEIENVPNYEQDAVLEKRVLNGLIKLNEKYDHKTFLIVSHSHAIKGLLKAIDPINYSYKTRLENGQIIKITSQNSNIFNVFKL